MNDPTSLWPLVTLVSSAGTAALAFALGSRRVRRAASRELEHIHDKNMADRASYDGRLRDLLSEAARLRALCLAPRELADRSIFRDRMAPAEHEELLSLLQGMAFVDDAVIADGSGLSLTRETNVESIRLAALTVPVQTLIRALAAAGAGVDEIHLETLDANHVTARALVGRAAGSYLLVRSTSRPVNPFAMDAVAQVAAGAGWEPNGRPPAQWRNTSDRVRDEAVESEVFRDLEVEFARAGLRGLVLGCKGRLVYSASVDGPNEGIRADVFEACEVFQTHVARTLRSIGTACVDVTLQGGGKLRWSAVSDDAEHGLLFFADDGATSPALVERVRGRLRRGIERSRSVSSSLTSPASRHEFGQRAGSL